MNEGLRASVASALSEQQQRIAALERLKRDAVLFGFEISTNVPYDGNCFFTAVAHATGRSSQQTSMPTLRHQLTSYLQTKVGYTFIAN